MTYGQKMSAIPCIFFFPQCGDNDTSVATFVATLVIMLRTTALKYYCKLKSIKMTNGFRSFSLIKIVNYYVNHK